MWVRVRVIAIYLQRDSLGWLCVLLSTTAIYYGPRDRHTDRDKDGVPPCVAANTRRAATRFFIYRRQRSGGPIETSGGLWTPDLEW